MKGSTDALQRCKTHYKAVYTTVTEGETSKRVHMSRRGLAHKPACIEGNLEPKQLELTCLVTFRRIFRTVGRFVATIPSSRLDGMIILAGYIAHRE